MAAGSGRATVPDTSPISSPMVPGRAHAGGVVNAAADFRHDVADWVLAMPVAAALRILVQ